MSTIQHGRSAIAHRYWMHVLSFSGIQLAALFCSSSFDQLRAQDQPETPAAAPATPSQFIDDGRSFDTVKIVGNDTKVRLMENFTKELEFNERLVTVEGFDDNTIRVTATAPNKLRILGLEQNVTTLTITGESKQKYQVHVYVTGDARQLQAVLQDLFPNSAISVNKLINGSIVLTGYVTDSQTITNIMDVATLYSPQVVNHMRVGGPQEVQLRVKILEVQRSKLRTFGMDMAVLTQSAVLASTPSGIAPVTSLINPIGGQPSVTMNPSSTNPPSLTAAFNNNHFAFSAFLQVLKEEGLLKIHTEPVVVTRSGEPAKFQNGGEFPIPIPGGLGTVTITFKEFGVILETLPIVVSPTRVKQQVRAIVSDKDTANSITLQGTSVPGLTKREVWSTVEMNFGETMVLAGLVNTREQGSTLKTPIIGEMPVVGAMFRKVVYQQAETELLIMITPEFGGSLTADQIPPGGPGMFTTTPNDRELYGHGLLEVPNYNPGCGPECENMPNSYGPPQQPYYGPGPSITPSQSTHPHGLIGPPGSEEEGPILPAPDGGDGVTTRKSSKRSQQVAKAPRGGGVSKRKPKADTDEEEDGILPAGFQNKNKSQSSRPKESKTKSNRFD